MRHFCARQLNNRDKVFDLAKQFPETHLASNSPSRTDVTDPLGKLKEAFHGRYLIERELGAGGMATVYLADDLKHHRKVAIKVMRPELSAAVGPERFLREITTTANLRHPHILPVFDSGDAEGSLFYVMPLVEGESLRTRLTREKHLGVEDALHIVKEVADGLGYAHGRGVIHRDIKPENILLESGHAVIVDFGIAKALSAAGSNALTQTGLSLGTPQYMSPEQAAAEQDLDGRSDLYSLACVLYEMLGGQPPFSGPSAQSLIHQHIMIPAPPVTNLRPGIPMPVVAALQRALAKTAADRFHSIAKFVEALERAPSAPQDQPSIAVLPFANMSRDRDDEYFSDGLAEELINVLAHIPNLKVTARTSAFAFRGKEQDIRGIAAALGVKMILEGSVRRAGSRIRVTAQLISADDGYQVWSEHYERELNDVFAIQDEIAQAIADALQVKLAARFARARHTPKMPAYEALLKGRHHMLRLSAESAARATDCFKQAMALDPGFAEPHASLGLNYFLLAMNGMGSLKDVMPLVDAEATQALQLEPSDAAPHFLLGAVAAAYEYDWKNAGEHFRVATAGPAVSAEAHWAYASLYLQPLGRFEEAVFQMERAVERDPLNAMWRGVLTSHLTHAQLYDRAIDQAKEAMTIDARHLVPFNTLGEAYVTLGRWPEAIEALEQAYRIMPHFALTTGMLAGALARSGERMRAEQLIPEMGEGSQPVMGRVLYHVLCSEMELAAEWYERAIEQRDPFALVFANTPLLSVFRQTPHWQKLAKMMNLPEPRRK